MCAPLLPYYTDIYGPEPSLKPMEDEKRRLNRSIKIYFTKGGRINDIFCKGRISILAKTESFFFARLFP